MARSRAARTPRTWRALLSDWLPAAGFVPIEAPDFERYDAAFNPATGYGGVDICIPVEGVSRTC